MYCLFHFSLISWVELRMKENKTKPYTILIKLLALIMLILMHCLLIMNLLRLHLGLLNLFMNYVILENLLINLKIFKEQYLRQFLN